MGLTDHKLKFVIDADGKAARKELVDIDKLIGNVGSGLGGWAGPAAIGATAIAGIGAAGVATGVALFNLTKQAADYGSEIYNASVKTGLSAETMSAFKLAADRTGVSLESVGTIVGRFSKTVGEAAQGSTEAKEKLTRLGIDPKKAINDLDGALGSAIKQIYNMESPIAKATAAQQLFGKAGTELLKVIDDTKGNLPGLIAEAKRLGLTLSDEDAKAADEFGDQMDVLNGQISAASRSIGQAFMPIFLEMAQGVSEWLTKNKGEVREWADSFASAVTSTSHALSGMAIEVQENQESSLLSWTNWTLKLANILTTGPLANAIAGLKAAFAELEKKGAAPTSLPSGFYGHNVPVASPTRVAPDYLKDLGGTTGTGRTRRPPHETDSEFRKFFTERGFGVNRTFGGAINPGSLHPSGQAADVSINGKSVAEIFALTAAALEKGYRLFDERVKRPGVKQTGPHLHFERGGSLKDSSFLGAGMYGGADQLAYLQSLDAERRGKASGTSGLAGFQKDQQAAADDWEKNLQQVYDDWMAQDKAASDDRLSLRQEEADQAVAILDDYVENGYITEKDYVERIGELKLGLLEDERAEVAQLHSTKENTQRLTVLDLKIETQKIKNATEITKQTKEQLDHEQKLRAVRNKSWNEYIKNIKAASDAQDELDAKQGRAKYESGTITGGTGLGGSIAQGLGVELVPMFDEATNAMLSFQERMNLVGQDVNNFVGGALAGMIEGLAQMGAAWLAGGQVSAQAALQMVSSAAFSVATQAGFKAIFEFAEGLAAQAATFGVPNPSSVMHFAAASTYATVAAIAGGVGVVAGLGARAAGGGGKGGSGRGSSSSGGQVRQEDLRPISRVSDDAYTSGHRDTQAAFVAKAIEKLTKKIEGMRPGDVVAAGFKQRKGIVATQFNEDIARRPQLGSATLRKMGGR